MSKKHRFFNMQLTALVSITLVLLLIGMECVLLLSAGSLIKRIKENVTMDIVLAQQPDSALCGRIETMLDNSPYCAYYRYISSQEALEEHIEMLGDDPTTFLGYNPLSAAYELHLHMDYANTDSMAVIEANLQSLPYVEDVVYQRDLLRLMGRNLSKATLFLLVIAVILLIIAQALIVNTIRLQIYAKRFIIRTMALVGATSWHIRRPFMLRSMCMGAEAAIVSFLILLGAVYYIREQMGVVLFPLNWQYITLLVSVLLVIGMLITLIASSVATGKYIRMKTDKIYEI